jgi:hypothetical protein
MGARRQELLENAQRLIAEGQKPDDPIAIYMTLFMGNASPENQATLAAKLREIDAALRQCPNEPVLLVQRHATPSESPGCCRGGIAISALPVLHLGLMGEGGLIFDFAEPTHIALSTTKHVTSVVHDDLKVQDGPMPILDCLLGSILGLGLGFEKAELVIGYEAVTQYGYRAAMFGNSELAAELMHLLGASLPDPTDP